MTDSGFGAGRTSIISRVRKYFAPIDHRAHVSKQLKMLLNESELSVSGFTFAGEQSWTIGARGLTGPEIERAKQRGKLNVWRRFTNKPEKRSLWIQVGEFASASDATSFAPALFESLKQRPGVSTELVESTETLNVPGLSSMFTCEERSPQQEGVRGIRLIVGTIDHWLLSLGFSAMDGVWTWDEVTAITAAQVQKINNTTS
jgi:hypothetical protein